ncbi:Uma2 family endonuclease [Thiohalocapsa sp. ML1]|uniref:Uma2 family endonuclease n=1 Tax=Thiohalocapsa sp. ML1 TaxID=1431688 RepID=UPI000731F229|nr:Uma2 family endonuclease [Thiohalocapsa sp. ML1]
MSTAVAPPAEPTTTQDQRILLEGVPWARYEQLSACFEGSRALRLTYIDGSLEIMSPVGPTHANWKQTLCYLLQAFLDVNGIRFYGRGGFTLTQPGRAGGEPDASYCIGTDKPVPDLVIEVVDTSDALSKLPLYQSLGIAEVWLWRRERLELHVLDQAEQPSQCSYRLSAASRLLPDLDPDLLARHVRMPDQYDAVRAFRRAIGG